MELEKNRNLELTTPLRRKRFFTKNDLGYGAGSREYLVDSEKRIFDYNKFMVPKPKPQTTNPKPPIGKY